MKKIFLSVSIICILGSCVTEKSNTSPVPAGVTTENKTGDEPGISLRISENTYASEITNLLSTFPIFSKKEVNDEISSLKYSLQNYLYAVDAGNIGAKNKQLKGVEKSYRKIQKLRKSLSTDENDILNRYLVRIKTNMAIIENTINASKK